MSFDLQKLNSRTASCLERAEHVKRLGFQPDVIFDVGAFIGKWAKEMSEVFSESEFVLFEPNRNLNGLITENTAKFKDKCFVQNVAAGPEHGKMMLNIWKNPGHNNEFTALAASSVLTHVQGEPEEKLEVEVKTIDSICEDTGKYPDLLKLDLQGFEKPALLGAEKALEHAELCIIEFGCLDAYEGRTTSFDVHKIMYENGFVLYDIVDLRYRPYDAALVGGDYFFVKANSKLKKHKDYF